MFDLGEEGYVLGFSLESSFLIAFGTRRLSICYCAGGKWSATPKSW
jgi:hypothetical protein